MAAEANVVKALFLAALEKTPAERAAFLEQVCPGDAVLRKRVEALLRTHDQPDSLLERHAVKQRRASMESTPPSPPDSGPPLPAWSGVAQALGAGLPPVQLRELEGETDTKDHLPGIPLASSAEARELPARYQMAEEIARGGMGCVLRGRDTELCRDIAVKVLLETHQGRTELVQRFVDEAQIAGQLQHPGITPVYDVGTSTGKRPYFTMKLVKGQTLAKLLAERTVGPASSRPADEAGWKPAPQDLPRFLKVFEQVCQTLAYAHARGVIHRDLKPANIMVGAYGEVQVMDWGLAKVLASRGRESPEAEQPEDFSVIATARSSGSDAESGRTQAGTAMGTPAYMSPEQARGEVDRIDERADVFGLGALLCQILTGKPPFPGKSQEAMRQAKEANLTGALKLLDSCGADGELIALAKRCLAAEPEDRPRHAGEVAGGMTAYLESVEARLRQAELERAKAQVKAVEERKRRRLTVALAASILLTVLLGGGGYGWFQQQRSARRAETARKVDEALQHAAVLLGEAATAAVGDLSGWAQVQAEARRAEDLLAQGEADAALRDRVVALQAELEMKRAEAQLRADDALAERRLLARLEAIRGERSTLDDDRRIDRAYAEAFRTFGVDMDVIDPRMAGARLKGRPGTAEVAAALDEWSSIRRVHLAREEGIGSWQRLTQAAQACDPDPWRNGLRALFGHSPAETTAALKKQADDVAALEQQPAASLVLLARHLHRAGQRDRAAVVLRAAWRRFPGDFWVNFELGYSSWNGQYLARPEEAVRFLTAAVAARPDSSFAHVALGTALDRQGKLDEASAAYRHAIEIVPKNPMGHVALGTALDKQGKLDEAIASYRQAMALDPKVAAGCLVGIGNALDKQGKLEEACTAYQRSIQIDAKLAVAYAGLGNVLSKQGKLDEAIAAFRQASSLAPQYALPLNLTVLTMQPKAAAQAKRLLAVQGRFPAFLDGAYRPRDNDERLGLAVLCERKKRYLAAVRLYADAFAADPRLAEDIQAGRRMRVGPRFDAASCAARLGSGQGEDGALLDDSERARWRKQALAWMKSELVVRSKAMKSWIPGAGNTAQQELRIWQHDSSLAGIRDKEALVRLPAEERQACQQFWAEVEALPMKAQPKLAPK